MKNISYFKFVKKNKDKLKVSSLLSPFFFTLEGLQSTLAWLSSGPMILVLILTPFLTQNFTIIFLSYLAVFTYGPLQYLVFYLNTQFMFKQADFRYKSKNKEAFLMTLLSIPAIVFNSIPPYFSIFCEIKSYINKQEIYKPKTDD